MHLTQDQIDQYRHEGYLNLPGVFTGTALETLQGAMRRITMATRDWNFLETEGGPVRAYNACHWDEPVFADLVHAPETLIPARQILGGDVHLFQFKMNPKAPFGGSTGWAWHQDYPRWKTSDGMLENRALNIAVFLDEVTEFNGPLFLVPGSHQNGALAGQEANATPGVTALNLTHDVVSRAIDARGLVSAKGAAGAVLLFDPNIIHASTSNISPFTRHTVYLTYNAVTNRLVNPTRAQHIASTDYTPLRLPGEAA
ncbi:MAG: phytanoyl-CoA dioxygenase family protein [Paracoccaceae bacterium]|nr:phytanoyl-CoA dioxygenase family protein [Paracoccaceae bacterium]